MSTISRGSIQVSGFSDAEMDFQLIRQLGSSAYKGASIGESLHIANAIKGNDPKLWVKEFVRLAEWQKKDGLDRLAKKHVVSAREQLLKAANSFRAAEYYSPCSSEDHKKFGLNSADCFAIAVSNMDIHFENHSLPYKNITIPAYFIAPKKDGKKRPTIMIVSGFDGTLEEEFILRGLAAIERGYNVIHFAGPGQMDVFRKYPAACFEAQFEQVVKAVIDYFEIRPEINMAHLALMGISFGGYFATRAACYEPRIKALIANSPILDLHAYLCSFVPYDPDDIPESEDFTINDFPSIPDELMSPQLKAQTEHLITRFGQKSFKKTFDHLKSFIIDRSLSTLKVPCLALMGEDEGEEPKIQFKHFINETNADHYTFNNLEGAGSHCQVGNLTYANAVAYDWLDQANLRIETT